VGLRGLRRNSRREIRPPKVASIVAYLIAARLIAARLVAARLITARLIAARLIAARLIAAQSTIRLKDETVEKLDCLRAWRVTWLIGQSRDGSEVFSAA
jgi:hypothetical protein